MGKTTGFLEHERNTTGYIPVRQRITNYSEFTIDLSQEQLSQQGARCMDCGIPFCHTGCPLNNIIPEWNDLVYRNQWQDAIAVLHSTNNFPEFTGRICPAPCEEACTLNLETKPVAIKTIENAIIETAWKNGWIAPQIPERLTGKQVAIVGSGPAGLACAQQLTRAGHEVVVYEKEIRIGGLLRFGIPDFKLDKHVIDRRIEQMKAEGTSFRINTEVGRDIKAKALVKAFDAVVLAGGSEHPRDLSIPGRELDGVYFAMEFLKANSKMVQNLITDEDFISARDKHVVVIGGGDTGSDCIGTSTRHKAASITQLEILAKPPEKEEKATTWPHWPNKLRTSSSHEEGCERYWSVATKEFIGEKGKVTAVKCIKVEWTKDDRDQWQMREVAGSEFELKADLVTLAMGFVHPIHEGLIKELDVKLDDIGNIKARTAGKSAWQTTYNKVFSAGDMRRGQSLVVWAIHEGRQCAKAVDQFLMGSTTLAG